MELLTIMLCNMDLKAYNETLSAISDNCLGYFGSNDNKTFVFEHNKRKFQLQDFVIE